MDSAGLIVWLTLQCHGGAARITVPDYVANYTMLQVDDTGAWTLAPIPDNATVDMTGLGIKFEANVSIANKALKTLKYGKGQDNVHILSASCISMCISRRLGSFYPISHE